MDTFFSNPNTIMFFQLLLALVLGGILGIQRSLSHKGAGMRTFSLVAMGSCLFVMISEIIHARALGVGDVIPTQIPGAIITGIGFLGAGLIIFKDDKLKGLTTAAGLWVACGIGIATGFQLYVLSIFATVLTLVVFTVLWKVETAIKETGSEYSEESGEIK
ncbi:MAG: MgtC/SapB family protein [Candidatus Pacebacteria bacterium]|nr:MgtC/SapB family protein [Candidatus Paceibacterota bacterium]